MIATARTDNHHLAVALLGDIQVDAGAVAGIVQVAVLLQDFGFRQAIASQRTFRPLQALVGGLAFGIEQQGLRGIEFDFRFLGISCPADEPQQEERQRSVRK